MKPLPPRRVLWQPLAIKPPGRLPPGASCHPNGHIDGPASDSEADGTESSPADNRTLHGIDEPSDFPMKVSSPRIILLRLSAVKSSLERPLRVQR